MLSGITLLASSASSDGPITEPVTWGNDIGVLVAGNSLTKAGPDGWDAGAASTKAIARGDGEEAARLLFEHAVRSRERLHRTLDRPASPTSGRAKRAAPGRNP